ncbi:MAG: Oxaloacetate decarboxylase alpha chain [Desulfovibrio sp.]
MEYLAKIRAGAAAKPVKLSSVEFRDGQQSLLATRMRTADMLPILEKMDEIGYACMEMWGGATFDSCIRFLDEDPWERVRLFKNAVKNTPLRMLLRGQNLVGYRQYPDDIVERFVTAAADAGIDIFLIFDGLNDLRNCEAATKAVIRAGKTPEANILYTLSPVHSTEKYVEIAKGFENMGMQAIHLEDMAGMVDPVSVGETIRAIKAAISVPLHFQSHCTGGMADIAYWEAVHAGADVIDVDVSALALGTSHPPAESMVVALANTPWATGLDLGQLAVVNAYFLQLREKYKEFESAFTGVDISVLRHQVPGGMLSNLERQLKEMDVADRLDEILAETARVRKDFGYPPLGTPFSQIVGAQAAMNVITGERYAVLPEESIAYIKGAYGKTPGAVDAELARKVLGDEKPLTCRPADLLEPEYEKLKAECAAFARTEEDVLTYAMFPSVAEGFLKKKYSAP